MKKTILLSLVVGLGIGLYFGQNQPAPQQNHQRTIVQSVKTKQSSLGSMFKTAAEIEQDEADTANRKEAEITKTMELQNLGDMNKMIESSLGQTLPKDKDTSALRNYIQQFDFNAEYKKEYRKLHRDDISTILEVLEHPISKKLRQNDQKVQAELADYLKTGRQISLTERQKSLINEIVIETNAFEQSKSLIRSMMTMAYTSAVLKMNPKSTRAEAQAKSVAMADQMTEQQTPMLAQVFDLSYSKLNESDLEEYLHYMQKVDGRKATEINIAVTEKVMGKFLGGLVDEMVKLHRSKTPNTTRI